MRVCAWACTHICVCLYVCVCVSVYLHSCVYMRGCVRDERDSSASVYTALSLLPTLLSPPGVVRTPVSKRLGGADFMRQWERGTWG